MKKNQQGLTLIEMMIAMVVGLLLTAAVMTLFIANVRANSDSVAMIRLNQELRGVMTIISTEFKRAGYSADPTVDTFKNELNSSLNCLRYSYDENNDGIQNANERFGFQFKENEIRWSRNNTNTDCSAASWESITEKSIANITTVNFTPSDVIAGSVIINQILVTIEATTNLSGSVTATRSISELIRLRNDSTI